MKYCDEIKSIVRNKTFSIEAKCSVVDQTMENTSPLEIYSPYSRFLFTILDKAQGRRVPVKANVIIQDVASIISRTNYAVKKIIESEATPVQAGQDTPAFTERFRFGDFKGRTAAEVLLASPKNKDALLRHRSMLQENINKFPSNRAMIAAMDEAISLFDMGKLSKGSAPVASTSIKIYESSVKYFTSQKERDSEGRYKIYQIKIHCDPTRNYPFEVAIMNCYAPVLRTPQKLTNIKMANAVNKLHFNMVLSEAEWLDVIRMMQVSMRNFEILNAQAAHRQNEEIRWKPDTADTNNNYRQA